MYKPVLFILIITSILFGHIKADEASYTPGKVVSLTEANFESFFKDNGPALVKFFAPWCGHCKALAPEYEEAASILSGKAYIAEVDCTKDDSICRKFEINGYPTLKYIDGTNTLREYNAERSALPIANFVLRQNAEDYTTIHDDETLESMLNATGSDVRAILRTSNNTTSESKLFASLANELNEYVDFILYPSVSHEKPVLTLRRTFDEPVVDYDGKFVKQDMKNFIQSNSQPLLGEINRSNYERYVKANKDITWFVYNYENSTDIEKVESIRKVLSDFKHALSFVRLNSIVWGVSAQSIGFDGTTPYLVTERIQEHKFYPMLEKLSEESLRKYLQDIVDNKVPPLVKSQKLPEDADTQVVRPIVRTTYNTTVLDPTKNVFVAITAPWCKHCENFKPVLERVAEHFHDRSDIIIGNVDGTRNDLDIDIQGFPTLLFYKAGADKEPMTYTNDRVFDSVVDFITQNSVQQSDIHDEL
uniref:protein disulfide-isomerase n=1 Tax=Lygus hesperus TaxID=30085 RepID=A0A0A9XID5_LYGHE